RCGWRGGDAEAGVAGFTQLLVVRDATHETADDESEGDGAHHQQQDAGRREGERADGLFVFGHGPLTRPKDCGGTSVFDLVVMAGPPRPFGRTPLAPA